MRARDPAGDAPAQRTGVAACPGCGRVVRTHTGYCIYCGAGVGPEPNPFSWDAVRLHRDHGFSRAPSAGPADTLRGRRPAAALAVLALVILAVLGLAYLVVYLFNELGRVLSVPL